MVVETIKFQAKLARRAARRSVKRLRDPRLAHAPILFGNSFPKSGTHLLTQVLAGFTRLGPAVDSGLPAILTFEGESGKPRPQSVILKELARLLPGDIAYGHLHAEPPIMAALCREGVASFFIFRDPRDVVVSHVFYVTDIANKHVHHNFYTNELHTFDERLHVSILGRPELDIPFPDIRARFEPYLPWLDQPDVLSLRYEDFVSESRETLSRVLDHAIARGFPYSDDRQTAINMLASAIDPKRSPTFRKGESGGWREHFTPEAKALFKDITGDLLVRLSYERGADW